MSKGMSMEQFREALSSEATVENEKLKKELAKLKRDSDKQIIELTEELDQYKNWCKALSNRCFVYTQGVLCMNCGVTECEYGLTPEDWDAVTEYMRKNNIAKTAEGFVKAIEFLQKRRFSKNVNIKKDK